MQTGYSDVLIGLQYGDEGKARIVDMIASDYDIIARFNGGANAGHTIQTERGGIALQQIPSGIFYEHIGLYIGSGCVTNIEKLATEIQKINNLGIDLSKRLRISSQVSVVQPHHLLLDVLTGAAIGTTKNGIGPCYADQAMRMWGDRLLNIRIGDLVLDPEGCLKMIERNLTESAKLFGFSADEGTKFLDGIKANLSTISPYVEFDPLYLSSKVQNGARVLFEGAQSVMLDVTTGSVPYVTSSHTVVGASYVGGDLPPMYHRKTIGVAKAVMSRVGNGPFASEFGGKKSEEYCAITENGKPKFNREVEAAMDIEKLISSPEEFDVGVAFRTLSGEYGTVTSRPRRIGRLDLVQLSHTVRLNGVDEIYINKFDLLREFSRTKAGEIPVVESYELDGKEIEYVPGNETMGYKVKPLIKSYAGFSENLSAMRQIESLPESVKALIALIEKRIGSKIAGIGVGPQREQFVRLS